MPSPRGAISCRARSGPADSGNCLLAVVGRAIAVGVGGVLAHVFAMLRVAEPAFALGVMALTHTTLLPGQDMSTPPVRSRPILRTCSTPCRHVEADGRTTVLDADQARNPGASRHPSRRLTYELAHRKLCMSAS